MIITIQNIIIIKVIVHQKKIHMKKGKNMLIKIKIEVEVIVKIIIKV